MHHAMWVNHTEIRCKNRSLPRRGGGPFGGLPHLYSPKCLESGLLGSSLAGSCIERVLRSEKMASEAIHAAWVALHVVVVHKAAHTSIRTSNEFYLGSAA
jgi:hypothetical protein